MARSRGAAVVAFLIHLGLVVLVFLPPVIAATLDRPLTTEGGGVGPTGGGGGGRRGSGLEPVRTERLVYVRIAPSPVAPEVTPPVPTPTPVTPPVPPPEKRPDPPVTPPAPVPPAAEAPPAPAVAASGTGAGTTGGPGAGPGSGGGIGTGIGTGRGAATGPGIGGGPDDVVPPQVRNFIPIFPPKSARPYTLVAWFDVDERGNTTLIAFNPSKDRAFNKQLREMLSEVRFRPAVRADGTPVRDTVSISVAAP